MSQLTWAKLSDITHVLTWLGWATLLLTQAVDAWVYHMPWILWLGKLMPLLMFLPGMLAKNLRSYIWLCFVSLLYFIALVEKLFAEPTNVLAMIGMLSVVTVFIAAMLFVRWRARALSDGAHSQRSQSGEVNE